MKLEIIDIEVYLRRMGREDMADLLEEEMKRLKPKPVLASEPEVEHLLAADILRRVRSRLRNVLTEPIYETLNMLELAEIVASRLERIEANELRIADLQNQLSRIQYPDTTGQ